MRKTAEKHNLHGSGHKDRDYWLSQSPKARIEAVTFLINQYYGLDNESSPRLQRVLTVTRRPLRHRGDGGLKAQS